MSVDESIVLLSSVSSDAWGRLVPATALLVAIDGYGTSPGVVKRASRSGSDALLHNQPPPTLTASTTTAINNLRCCWGKRGTKTLYPLQKYVD